MKKKICYRISLLIESWVLGKAHIPPTFTLKVGNSFTLRKLASTKTNPLKMAMPVGETKTFTLREKIRIDGKISTTDQYSPITDDLVRCSRRKTPGSFVLKTKTSLYLLRYCE